MSEAGHQEWKHCPQCHTENHPSSRTCHGCGYLFDPVESFNPVDRGRLEASVLSDSLRGPANRTLVIGVWLMYFPSTFLCLYGAYHFADRGESLDNGMATFLALFGLGYTLYLAVVTRNYLSQKKTADEKS